MIEYDFEGYAKSQIDKGLSYLEGFSKGYHQAKSEWVGLTDEEIFEIWKKSMFINNGKYAVLNNQPFVHFAREIEAKFKDKNK